MASLLHKRFRPFWAIILTCFLLLGLFGMAKATSPAVRPEATPKPGYEERIHTAVRDIWLVDTHEHLGREVDRVQRTNVDFTDLFAQYAREDLISASSSSGVISLLTSHSFTLKDRWELFKPLFMAMRNTGYARVALIAARDLYGIDDLHDDTYVELSKRMQELNKPGLYRHVLQDKARIEVIIQDGDHCNSDSCVHVERFDHFISIFSGEEISQRGRSVEISVRSLEDYVAALRKAFLAGVDRHMVGVKSALAYNRILKYEDVPLEKARPIFDSLLTNPQRRWSFEQVKPLQDFVMHRVIDLAREFRVPMQIHTGLQAGNGNLITNSNPTHLVNLFMKYSDVNFCLMHSSYPYGGELSTLAKNFPNVIIDMCWSYAISPYYSEHYLHEWLDTVPASKIMGFGGDYTFPEGTYGHSVLARQSVANVLIDKVGKAEMREDEAIRIAKMILRENAMEIFRIKGKNRGIETLAAFQKPGFLHDWWQLHNSPVGFIRTWMVIGPFKYSGGLDEPFPPEKEIRPDAIYPGLGGSVGWTKATASESGYLDLKSLFNPGASIDPDITGIAYAYVEVISPDKRTVRLTLGSNDGAKVWVNGEVIYSEHIPRVAIADQIFLDANLQKGKNTILVKIENLGASWGLYLRLVDPKGELKVM